MSKLDKLTEKYTNIKDLYFECGDGWVDILEPVLDAINEYNKSAEEPIRIAQIKEKFGILHFYTDGHPDYIDALIDSAEAASETTCEVCGSEGEVRGGGWLRVLCDEHNKGRGK